MIVVLGWLAVAVGAVLVVPEIFRDSPDQARLAVGVLLAIIGACMVEDEAERRLGL